MNETLPIEYLHIYSTAAVEKAVSTGDDDPALMGADLCRVFLPSGSYRVIAGQVVRVVEGVPAS